MLLSIRSCLKEAIYQLDPTNVDIRDYGRQKEAICKVLPAACRSIEQEVVKAVLESMPKRIQAVIEGQGRQTKY